MKPLRANQSSSHTGSLHGSIKAAQANAVSRVRKNYKEACRMRENAQKAYRAEPTQARKTALDSADKFCVQMLAQLDRAEESDA